MKFKRRTLEQIADMICGNFDQTQSFFIYRTSSNISKFFRDCDTDYRHDGSTRASWVYNTLEAILAEPRVNIETPPDTFLRVIKVLMDWEDATNEGADRTEALALLNSALNREGYEAFYAPDKLCYLKHMVTNSVAIIAPNPHRPFSQLEVLRREQLSNYLDKVSEDNLIEEVLLPLFRQLGFQRITAAGHKDKALEYGKDIWMKFKLPTRNTIYFGIQVKKNKLDALGDSKAKNSNIAEIYNQVLMMIVHEVFDPEINKHALVDHAFIVSGGEITKQAKNWLGNKLDTTKRSQVLFMDRDDILNLYVVTNLQLPNRSSQKDTSR